MTDAASSAPPAPPQGRVTAWVWGGALLIASAVLPLGLSGSAAPGSVFTPVAFWVGKGLFAAAMLLFALGWQGRGSVVAGRPSGVIALVVLALWPVVGTFVMPALASTGVDYTPMLIWTYIEMAVWVAAALAAVVSIGRAGVLPSGWRWAPALGLGVVVLGYLLLQLVGLAAVTLGQQVIGPAYSLLSMITVVVPLLLGVLALVLGITPRPAGSVQIYPAAPGYAPGYPPPTGHAPGNPPPAGHAPGYPPPGNGTGTPPAPATPRAPGTPPGYAPGYPPPPGYGPGTPPAPATPPAPGTPPAGASPGDPAS